MCRGIKFQSGVYIMNIKTELDPDVGVLFIRMSGLNKLEHLKIWKSGLLETLADSSEKGEKITLFVDTHKHEFESYQCLRLLRELFTSELNGHECISRKVFVQPASYRKPEVIDEREAYFSDADEAMQWLRCN